MQCPHLPAPSALPNSTAPRTPPSPPPSAQMLSRLARPSSIRGLSRSFNYKAPIREMQFASEEVNNFQEHYKSLKVMNGAEANTEMCNEVLHNMAKFCTLSYKHCTYVCIAICILYTSLKHIARITYTSLMYLFAHPPKARTTCGPSTRSQTRRAARGSTPRPSQLPPASRPRTTRTTRAGGRASRSPSSTAARTSPGVSR